MKRLYGLFLYSLILMMAVAISPAGAQTTLTIEGEEGAVNTNVTVFPYISNWGGSKTQIIYKASELYKFNIGPGTVIRGFALKHNTGTNLPLRRFRIRMGHTQLSEFTAMFVNSGLRVVKGGDTQQSQYISGVVQGESEWKVINFDNNFTWNGRDNIIIEIAWTNGNTGDNADRWQSIQCFKEEDEEGDEVDRVLYKNQDNKANLTAFDESGNTSTNIPKMQFIVDPAYPVFFATNTNEMDYGYLKPNTMSKAKKLTIKSYNIPENSDLVITPETNAYVALTQDATTWVTAPNTLTISSNPREEKVVWVKMKSGDLQPRYYSKLKFTAGNTTDSLQLKASSNRVHIYCSSGATSTRDSEIGNVSIKQGDKIIFSNGDAKPIYGRADANNTYSDFTETVKPPTLKLGEIYEFNVSPIVPGTNLYTTIIKAYIDFNNDAILTENEVIYNTRTMPGRELPDNTYYKEVILDQEAVWAKDSLFLLRVVQVEGTNAEVEPCGTYGWGETEDYFVKLIAPGPREISNIDCKQVSPEATSKGTEKLPMLRAEVAVSGTVGNLAIRQLVFDTEGSYDLSSIKNARLYYTKDKLDIDNKSEIVGEIITNPDGDMVFTPATPIDVKLGKHNFILTYDIGENSDEEAVIDARFKGLYVVGSDSNYVSKIFDPKGLVTIVNIALSMSFEGLRWNFGGSEWFSKIEENGSSKKWSVTSSITNPDVEAKHGQKFAYFDAYSGNQFQKETLISEKISLTEPGSKELTFWFYKHNNYSSQDGTTLQVLISNSKVINADAVALTPSGDATNPLNIKINMPPMVDAPGWYKYSFIIPETFNTEENYLFFRASSDYWNKLCIDDIKIMGGRIMYIDAVDILPIKSKFLMPGSTGKNIGGININTKSSNKKIIVKKLLFDLTGTTNVADIDKIKLWKMPENDNSGKFDIQSAIELGSVTDPKIKDNNVSLVNHVLKEGNNTIYVTVDTKEGATVGNFVDIDFKKIIITRETKENTFLREIKITDGNNKGKAEIKDGLNGEYIVGGPEVPGNYFEDLKSAIEAINELGTSGNVVFAINSDIEVTQNTPIIIKNFYRKDTTSTLTIYPKDQVRTIRGKYTSKVADPTAAFFSLIGVQDVTIDGRINRSDENKDTYGFVFANSGKKEYAHAIMLATIEPNTEEEKTVKNIQINNTDLSCGGNTSDESAIYFNGKDIENIRILKNKISNTSYGIFTELPKANAWNTVVKNLKIEDNYFGNTDVVNSVGIAGMILRNAEDVNIENNKMENINTSAIISTFGVYIGPKSKNININYNTIRNLYGRNGNEAYAICLAANDNTKIKNVKIKNNVVNRVLSDVNQENHVSPIIFVIATDSVEMYHNTVILDGDKGEIPGIGNRDAKSILLPLGLVNTNHTIIKNNIFANRITAEDRITGGNIIYYFENDNNTLLDHNAYDIEITETNPNIFAFCRGRAFVELEDFKRENLTFDQNSGMSDIYLDPQHPVLGTIAGKTALGKNMRAPAIAGLEELKDIHGNARPADVVTIGADQVSAPIEVTYITPEINNICTPGKGEIKVTAVVGEFDDGIQRNREGVEPYFVYDWQKNGKHIDNLRPFTEDANGDGILEEVMKPVNSNVFYPEVLEDNLDNPDYYTVKVSGFGKAIVSEATKVTGEEKITITKQMDEFIELCTETGITKISPEVKGTVGGYQWQKEINNKWVNLEGDTERELSVELLNPKYGEGKYRVILKDGANHCTNGDVYSQPTTLSSVDPVRNAVLYSPQADENGRVEMCEGEPLKVELKRQELQGDVFGYRWEELVDGNWVECDSEKRDYLTEDGFSFKSSKPIHTGKFRLVVVGSQLCDTKEAISNVIDIKINPYARVIKDAKPTIVCKDEMISIALEVEADNPRYQWKKDGVEISLTENVTANKPIFIIEKAKYEDAGSYQATILVDGCIEDGSYGKLESQPATVFVMNETQITEQPVSVTAIKGRYARLEVRANAVGAPPHYMPEYQWYKGTKKLVDGEKYSGSNANILLINNVSEADAAGADYFVVVKGLCGDTLTSNKVKIKLTTLAFSKHLENKVVCSGDEVKLEAKAETTYPNAIIQYEWHFVNDGLDRIVQNGEGNSLTFIAEPNNNGKYYVLAKVEGVENSVKSNTAEVRVNLTPVITKALGITTAKLGENFTLNVKASGNDLVYKWYRDGKLINEANSATLTRSETELGSHVYKVEVTNNCGSVSSEGTVIIEQNMANVEQDNTGFTVSSVVPNPIVTNEAKFSVNTEETSYAEITITDARGKSTQLFSGNIAGTKEFTVNTNGYVNGTYYLVININGKSITRSFVVVK